MTIDLEGIKERAEKATPGPWYADNHLEEGDWLVIFDSPAKHDYGDIPKELACGFSANACSVVGIYRNPEELLANAEFMAHARQDVPDLLLALSQAETRIPKWISVTERLPEITQRWKDGPHNYESSDRILVFAEGKVQVGEYFGVSGNWAEDSGSRMKWPTHWMPLPEPPALLSPSKEGKE